MTDHGLVEAAVRGDQSALRALWEAERRWVAAVLLAYKPAEAEVDDLLQDVAMTLVRTISTLKDPGRFRPWLRSLVMNTARALGRHETVRRRVMADLRRKQPVPGAPDGVGHVDEIRHVLDAASALADAYREPLLLRAVQGLSVEQIGQLMELPQATVQTRIARARAMLREKLESRVAGLDRTESAAAAVSSPRA